MKRCAIISGGDRSSLSGIEECSYVIACDKGYVYCKQANILPDLILGDFDSFTSQLPKEIKIIRLPVEKDDTDTHHAFRMAIEKGFDEIYLYCALGGRIDHTLANLNSAIFAADNNIDTKIIADKETIIVSSHNIIRIKRKENCALSLFAADVCHGVSISGSLYDVEKIELNNRFPIGQSNGFVSDEVLISKEDGILIIVISSLG